MDIYETTKLEDVECTMYNVHADSMQVDVVPSQIKPDERRAEQDIEKGSPIYILGKE